MIHVQYSAWYLSLVYIMIAATGSANNNVTDSLIVATRLHLGNASRYIRFMFDAVSNKKPVREQKACRMLYPRH
jgi:hypothetical protein